MSSTPGDTISAHVGPHVWSDRLFRYWGKAHGDDQAEAFHPLIFHSLDVAAVALIYLQEHAPIRRLFAGCLNINETDVPNLIAFVAAIHDLGKFADNFQWKCPELAAAAGVTQRSDSRAHHDAVSVSFWNWARDATAIEALLATHVVGYRFDRWTALANASFGHHGTPPPEAPNFGDAMFNPSRADALNFVELCAKLLLLQPITARKGNASIQTLSWSVAGLVVLCDWIGSNTDWFPYSHPDNFRHDIRTYWDKAQSQARAALTSAGVCSRPTLPYAGATQLFESMRGRQLRPAQRRVESLVLDDGPQMFVLEDATGSGKTEAAMALAARLMDAGAVDGFYFALPTQATADQMFERVALSMPRLFALPGDISCVLSHSARDQHRWYQSMKLAEATPDRIPAEKDTASFRVSEWLAQSNKRALMAQLGAGTVDQCMLGVLRTKHQSLRLFGLQRKVLIIDEVHCYDAYVTTVLAELIRAQAALGGSVILLSATLSAGTRAALISSFLNGLGSRASSHVEPLQAPYPLLTQVTSQKIVIPHQMEPTPTSRRRVEIDYVDSLADILARIRDWLAAGKCVVWIRNTVGDAMDAYAALRPELGESCTLFHSRFALVDRQRIQTSVLFNLGKDSDAIQRCGQLIIATQVLSQSLDLDADEMVSDLAPIDEILQRQGRLRRHLRDAQGRLIDGEGMADDARGPVRLTIFGPPFTDQPERAWYSGFSGGAARVYEDHGRIWLTAKCIRSGLDLPQDFRTLVDRVYDPDAQIPEALIAASDRAEGSAMGQSQTGRYGCIKFKDGYIASGDWSDEERIVTRLGQSIEAVLARVENGRLLPWASDENGDGWSLSAIRIPSWWFSGNGLEVGDRWQPANPTLAALVEATQQDIARLKYRAIVVLQPTSEGGWHARLCGDLTLTYNPEKGLGYARQKG